MSRPALGAALGLLLGLAVLPFFYQGYYLESLTVIFFWAALASSWNLFCGQAGYMDFGSAAYVGLGAYGCSILMQAGWPLLPAALAGAGLCGAVALCLGLPTLRLKGAYFAIATLALAEALGQVCLEWESLTGGGLGITPPGRLPENAYYWLYLGLAALIAATGWLMGRSGLGLALKAIRQDEAAAARVGVNTTGAKLTAYVCASFFMGMLGGLDATRLGYLTPVDAFNVQITIKMVIMSILGGMGTVLGPVAGAALLQVVEDFLGASFVNQYLIMMGAIIVGVMLFLPKGVLGRGFGPGGRK